MGCRGCYSVMFSVLEKMGGCLYGQGQSIIIIFLVCGEGRRADQNVLPGGVADALTEGEGLVGG